MVNNADESLFEFYLMDIPNHKACLERSQIYSNVRVSHVDKLNMDSLAHLLELSLSKSIRH